MIVFPIQTENLSIRPFVKTDGEKIFAFENQTQPKVGYQRSYEELQNGTDALIEACREEMAGENRARLTLGIFHLRSHALLGHFHAVATEVRADEWKIDYFKLKDRDTYAVEFLYALWPYFEKNLKAQFVVVSAKRTGWQMRDYLERSGFMPTGIEFGQAHYQKTLAPVRLSLVGS